MPGAQQNRNRPDGLCASEVAIVSRWDRGMSTEQIAQDLGKPKRAIERVISYLVDNGEHRAHVKAMTAQSQALLTAIKAAR